MPFPVSRRGVLAAGLIGGLWLPSGCRSSDDVDALRIMVPNAPGGGYDTTARNLGEVLEGLGLTGHIEVFNVEGASGLVGLARTAHERGDGDLMMMMGLGVVGALMTQKSVVSFDQVTAVGRLISEPEVVAVAAGSRFATLEQLVTAWVRSPSSVRIGGGSSPGGPDHLCAHLLAEAAGIDPREVRYTRYDGGGPLLAALFANQVDVAVSGVGEYIAQFRNEELRFLAVTSQEPVAGLPAPTVREQGVDLEFGNWRGLVAPPHLTAGDRGRLEKLLVEMRGSSPWQAVVDANGWTDELLLGPQFASFIAEERARVARVLEALDLLSA
ncbi:MAG TPA: tripartite tricarboxylate transporter substrate binding protein [Nocardioides sp.]|uniref:Bug family tripartite tricarboxylate transporter substrate binding protein n=1 Tax=uncultured Nocardioides sp. TaxID=198441 RepID=UPI0026175E19|nr:tripartite tricarboxylate transporter substrate binding protein [uncultured Nocardioides sp.]HRD60364.1 tripartite tricarboxylate transporter substrate binding protein [Nocardioides sp.]HRK44911.1 tripartite tricarboxylate transporter substrate binding protein [Nocardioides sp.]